MNADARGAVARAFEEILRRRHPGVSFLVPDVRAQAETPARSGKVIRSVAAPVHARTVTDGNAAAADEHDVEAGVE